LFQNSLHNKQSIYYLTNIDNNAQDTDYKIVHSIHECTVYINMN